MINSSNILEFVETNFQNLVNIGGPRNQNCLKVLPLDLNKLSTQRIALGGK